MNKPETTKLDALFEEAPCTLGECPEGLFSFDGHYGFKTEYKTKNESDGSWMTDAYCESSGEYFWGGAKTGSERERLIVNPVSIEGVKP